MERWYVAARKNRFDEPSCEVNWRPLAESHGSEALVTAISDTNDRPENDKGVIDGRLLVDRLVDRAVRALTDATRNNPLLYYRQSRSTRFTLPPLGSSFINTLLSNGELRVDDFQPLAAGLAQEESAPEATSEAGQKRAVKATPLQGRLQKIRAKARENEEERGLQTLFAAVGMVTWSVTDGGRPPLAPLFLVPMEIVEDKMRRGDFVVRRVPDGEAMFNHAILALAPTAFREVVADLFGGGFVDDIPAAYARIATAVSGSRDVVTLESTCALGIFNYATMAVVTDLREAHEALGAHIIIRALAGDGEAQAQLTQMRDGTFALGELDHVRPADEPLVLDADPWQSQSIQTIRRYGDSHATIDGPPGTGKSQTIANLIADLIAQGKSVLFCCEKRAALDVVKSRLKTVGLEHLILDLHGATVTRQRAYAQLKAARRAVSGVTAAPTMLDPILEQTRGELVDHDRFMHTPISAGGETPFELMSAIRNLPAFDLPFRVSATGVEAMRPQLEALERDVREAARWPKVFLHDPDTPWAAARILKADAIPSAIDLAVALAGSLERLQKAFGELSLNVDTRADLVRAVATLRSMRAALRTCSAEICAVQPETATLAARTLRSPFGALTQVFSLRQRAAVRGVRPLIGGRTGPIIAQAIEDLATLPDVWKRCASQVAELPAFIDDVLANILDNLTNLERLSGRSLPSTVVALSSWIAECAHDRDGAYRVARMIEIEARLIEAGLAALVARFSTIAPAHWAEALRFVYLQSRLEPLRPQIMRFDGRTQDDVVLRFADVERQLRTIAVDRVRRAAAERFIKVSRELREQTPALNVELERVRSKKPLRQLFEESPTLLLALAPCVMAGPLTVSQFLPRKTIFDVVIFDEGSQMAPESALTAILRGARVVIAGDDRQLPPTTFFASAVDDDEEDESIDAAAGTESVLAALRSFTKPLGLRVHYRSRDESLIAFSNYYLYDNSLITFPGAREDGRDAVEFVHVDPSGSEIDEDSATPEVAKVVDLILEHARSSPGLSLGVIALGSKHAMRIDTHLANERRSRPELDSFFDDTRSDAFFVKNLERVQGDERDRIILTIGYGRTKTGAVSHNFGPINQVGGERRLNVAITRARSNMTLVSSFRKADLNPAALSSRGAQLLAAYLAYAESRGRDLGRDGAVASVAASGIESDVQHALEERLGTTLISQYGVGKFRIDFAVQHPQFPGRFILAIEFDGATYHSSPTARFRDRQRQEILENMGWVFCRIWSTDWFNDRERELNRVDAIYRKALSEEMGSLRPLPAVPLPPKNTDTSRSKPTRVGSCPLGYVRSVTDISHAQFAELLAWISSDGLLRDDDELFEEMFSICGFERRGPRIKERFSAAISAFRRSAR